MIDADIIHEGEDEPFTSVILEQVPAVGDSLSIQEKPLGDWRHVEVVAREWFAYTHRHSGTGLVALTVRDRN